MPLPYTGSQLLNYANQSDANCVVLTPGKPPIFIEDGRELDSEFMYQLPPAEINILAMDLKKLAGPTEPSVNGVSVFDLVHGGQRYQVRHTDHEGFLMTEILKPTLPTIKAEELCGKHLGWTFRSLAYPNKNKTAKPYQTEREWEASTIYHLANGSITIGGGYLYLRPDTVLTVVKGADPSDN